jgi:uncharacterized membrane-anchored protein YitT (DUF2179 family)
LKNVVLSYLGVTIGSIIFAFGLNYFIIANGLAEGGITGLAIIVHYVTGWSVGLMLLLANIPLLLLGWKKWGSSFFFKTLWSVIVVSLALDLTKQYNLQTKDLLLAALYGGTFSGIGIGIVLRNGATTGGLDVIARFMYDKQGISVGKTYLTFDLAGLILVAFLFGLVKALYTLVALYIFSYVVDRVIEGVNQAKAVIIISKATAAITQLIINELDRGATVLKGYGAYTGREKNVLYVVVEKQQLLRLKKIVQSLDADAFVIVNNVFEVLGEGFHRPFK